MFDVRPGEGPRVLTMGGAMFAILAAHTLAETARDAMFLRAVPSRWLALVYLGLAAIAWLALAGNAALIRRVGRRHAMVSTLMVAAFGTTLFYVLGPGPAAAFALYLWTGLLGTIIVVQFWLLASTTFTSAEAKRLYGLIAAMGAVGALAGALLASGLLLIAHVEQLLPTAAAFYLAAGALLTAEASAPPTLAVRGPRAATAPPSGPPRLREQPYLLRLAAMVLIATAAALISDYLLKSSAAQRFAPDQLAGFFARYNGAVSALSLALQLVGASWILRRAGVLGAAMLLPTALLLGGVAMVATASAFAAVVLTKGADATLRFSVTRVANEVLWKPVSDAERAAVREPLESVATRLVQAGTAAALLGLGLAGLVTPRLLAVAVVGLAAVWVVIAASMRRSYLAQLGNALARPTFDTDQDLDLAALELVVEALSSTEDRRVIAAIQVLRAHERSRLIPALVLRHDSPEVLLAALDAIAVPGRTDWIPLTERLIDSDDPVVRIAAIRALARAGRRSAIQLGLQDPDPVVRASAVFWEAQSSGLTELIHDPEVAALLRADDDDADTARRILVDAIRDDGDLRWAPVLLELAASPAAEVEAIAAAIARVPDARFVAYLVERLGRRASRGAVRAALLAIGEPALAALEAALAAPTTAARVRLHIPTTVARFGSQRAADILLARLAQERSGAVRYRVLRGLARLAIHHRVRVDRARLLAELRHHLDEHFRLLALAVAMAQDADSRDSAGLVRSLLRDKISQARDRVLLALQSLHPREDVRGIERALAGADREARAHSLELLDTLTRAPSYADATGAGLREAILITFDDLDPAAQLERAAALRPPAPPLPRTAAAALTLMLDDADSLLAACAAHHVLQLDPAQLAESVRERAHEQPMRAALTGSPAAPAQPAPPAAAEPRGA
jgi:AAA family ATP:ADP antiporter